jgi:conjugal transfer/entry exclusion protein
MSAPFSGMSYTWGSKMGAQDHVLIQEERESHELSVEEGSFYKVTGTMKRALSALQLTNQIAAF